jgi:hypothetical protein
MTNVTHIRNNKPKTVAQWRNYISEPWQKAVESIIETGQRLIEAKEEVEYGEWGKIFENNKPFSLRTAEFLMGIAKNPVLTNPLHATLLPPSWFTLYQLSLIPAEDLQKLIDAGKVHSELTRAEAENLRADEQKQEGERQFLLSLLAKNIYTAREMSLADCGGSHYDFSILKGYVTQELVDGGEEVSKLWAKLTDHLRSLM